MKKILLGSILFCLFSISAFAQDDLDTNNGPLADRILAKKMAFFTDKLQLTSDELQNFWPLFTQYEKEQRQIKRKYKPTKAFRFMSDQEAEVHLLNTFKKEEELLAIKRSYFQKFKGVISIRKIAMINTVDRQFKEVLLRQMRDRKANRRN